MKKLLEWSGHGGKVEVVPALFAPLDLELIALVILLGLGVEKFNEFSCGQENNDFTANEFPIQGHDTFSGPE